MSAIHTPPLSDKSGTASAAALFTLIRESSWGGGLDDALLTMLLSHTHRQHVPQDTFVCTEGDPGEFMAFIVSGRLRVLKQDYFKMEQCIAQLGAGDSFGEMALVDDNPRSASIQAVEPTELLVLPVETFRRLLTEQPSLAVALLSQVSRVLSQRVRYLNRRILERLT